MTEVMTKASGRRVWVAGATGLVGREVLVALHADPGVAEVVALVRRPLPAVPGGDGARVRGHVVDFDRLVEAPPPGRCDVAICCLGTTIKQAGSQDAFRKVDHDYVLAFARAAIDAGAGHVLVVSSLGADPSSRVFYNRVKGEVERALGQLGVAVTVARPSLLLGDRSELRLGERVAAPLSRLLPARWRGIQAATVARALVRLSAQPATGTRVVPSEELQQLGR